MCDSAAATVAFHQDTRQAASRHEAICACRDAARNAARSGVALWRESHELNSKQFPAASDPSAARIGLWRRKRVVQDPEGNTAL
jgi:hypothetical protein